VRRFQPRHLIVCLGGNDLDVSDVDWDGECVVAKLVSFLTQLKNTFSLQTVTVLSYFPRQRTRTTSPEIYRDRVIEANRILQDMCRDHCLTFWKLRGFLQSDKPILCDGVHLSELGFRKFVRQLRGILLSQCRNSLRLY
jgi:lysophospholipase L1-like esterase